MIGQGELRTPHASPLTHDAAREHEQKLYVPTPGDIIRKVKLIYMGDMVLISWKNEKLSIIVITN